MTLCFTLFLWDKIAWLTVPVQNKTVHVLLIAHAVFTACVITIHFKDLHVRNQKSKRKKE